MLALEFVYYFDCKLGYTSQYIYQVVYIQFIIVHILSDAYRLYVRSHLILDSLLYVDGMISTLGQALDMVAMWSNEYLLVYTM